MVTLKLLMKGRTLSLPLLLTGLLTGLLFNTCFAGAPKIGQTLTHVNIASSGELHLKNDNFSYKRWDTGSLKGKMRTVQHIAGRLKSKSINNDFIDALKAAKLDTSLYETTTVVNLDDTLFGTQGFILHQVKKNKKDHPNASFIVDEIGTTQASWQLSPKSSAIVILNEEGKVIFFKDGQLTKVEIDELIVTLKIETARLATQKEKTQ